MRSFTDWLTHLTTPPGSTKQLIPVPNMVPAMEGAHAHKCLECALYFHLSPLGVGLCPACQSSHIIHIESWLRTPAEQEARSAARRSVRFVRAVNNGIPMPLPKKVVLLNSNGTVRTLASDDRERP